MTDTTTTDDRGIRFTIFTEVVFKMITVLIGGAFYKIIEK